MFKSELFDLIKAKGFTVTTLANRWCLSRQYIYVFLSNNSVRHRDAVAGLPVLPSRD